MKLIKNFVSKLLGGKTPAKKTTSKAPAKSTNSKSSTDSKRSRDSEKGKSTSGSARKSRSTNNRRRSQQDAPGRRERSGDNRQGERAPERSRSSERSGDNRQGEGASERRRSSERSGESRGSSPQQSRRSGGRKRTGAESEHGRVNSRTGGVARPQSRNSGGQNSRGVRPGGAIDAEERAKLQAAHAEWSLDSYKVEPVADKKRFHDFDLPSEIMHGIADMGFEYCTPIQALSLEHSLAGKNVAGKAQTGTGKTAAFLVAILTRYLRSPEKKMNKPGVPRALIIAPTRELVIQISRDAAALGKYCGLRMLSVYGGMDYERQKKEVLAEPIDLLVATPGRLLDYARRRVIDLSQVDTLVIDEADRMLDMGFIPDVRVIMNRLPPKDKRGTMLYSATLSEDVMRLASQWMDEPVNVEVESDSVATDTVEQVVYVVTASEKFTVLYNLLQKYPDKRILVFCNRKVTTEGIVRNLNRLNISCDMLSGDVNQNRRLRVLDDFRSGKTRIVIATDVAGRGIHVDEISFVVNYDFPYEAEDYVHRIGRTGRAGREGTAISFADEDESFIIPEIEAFIKQPLKCTMLMGDDPLMADIPRPGRSRPPRNTSRSVKVENKPPADAETASEPAKAGSGQSKIAPEPSNAGSELSEKKSENRAPLVEKKNSSIKKSLDSEKKTEIKKEAEVKKEPRSRSQSSRGRAASKPAQVANRRPHSSAERGRSTAARKSTSVADVAKNDHLKGTRFSEDWVPGQ